MAFTLDRRFERLARFADLVLVGGGLLCALVLFRSIYHFSLTEGPSLTSPVGMALYYGVPALLAASLFAALLLEGFKRIAVALVVVSIAFSIHAANLFLALIDVRSSSANRTLWFREADIADIVELAKQNHVEFDSRTKLQVIQDLKSAGVSAVPSIVPLSLLEQESPGTRRSVITLNGRETLPHGGISNRFTVYCNEEGQYVTYQSDEHGFHNPKGIWGADSVDAIALGDSFTQGGCVPSEKNFVSVIRNRYPKTLNLGMAGQGPLNTLATLKDYGNTVRPKFVFWFFYEGNDISDLIYERQSPLLMRYLEGGFNQNLVGRQLEIDQALANYIKVETAERNVPPRSDTESDRMRRTRQLLGKLAKLSPLRQRLGLIYGVSADSEGDPTDMANMELLDRALKVAKATVDDWGGKLFFVYLPERDSYLDHQRLVAERAQVLNIVRTVGLELIDLDPVFRSQSDPLALFPMRRLGHYNEKGHRLVGDEVLRSVSMIAD
jgi:hypothetical protein